MLETLRQSSDISVTHLSEEFQQDVCWWLAANVNVNRICVLEYMDLLQADVRLELDACPTGVGGIFSNEYYHSEIPLSVRGLLSGSAHFELLNVVLAAKLWAPQWAGYRVQFACDNTTAVAIINSGRT